MPSNVFKDFCTKAAFFEESNVQKLWHNQLNMIKTLTQWSAMSNLSPYEAKLYLSKV